MRTLLLLALATTGCLVVPKTTTTHSVVGTEHRDHPGPAGAVAIAVRSANADVSVRVVQQRTCQREVVELGRDRTATSADLAMPDCSGDARGCVAIALLAPVTVTISGIITAIVVAASHDEVTATERVVRRERVDCPVPLANEVVEVALPSGARVAGTTDASGSLELAIPDGEPDAGWVIARARGIASWPRIYVRSAAPGALASR